LLDWVLFVLIVISWIYWLTAWLWTRAFFRQASPSSTEGFMPPVSILKPVKGQDPEAYVNFDSFCRQDYPEFELLFGVDDPQGPVVPIIRRLQEKYPEVPIDIIVHGGHEPNRKAGLLHKLAEAARHDILVVSDSDMRVTPDYLRRVVHPLREKPIGLVTCLSRGAKPANLTARLEMLYMTVTFLPSVLVARRLGGIKFALGATMALRRQDLNQLGGFAAISDCVADDYQIGMRTARLGLKVHLSDYVVMNVLGATSFEEQWAREVRWARCIRICRPRGYPGLLFTFSTPLAFLLCIFNLFAWPALTCLTISIMLRWIVAWKVTGYLRDRESRASLLLLPLRDVLSVVVWCAGIGGRRVEWRGEKYRLRSGGRLELLTAWRSGLPGTVEEFVRSVDAFLQGYYRIFEFSNDERCLLRLSLRESDREFLLSDGTRIEKGHPVGELHLWNEHIPQIPSQGINLAWAVHIQRRMSKSLRLLAEFAENDPRGRRLRAFYGANSLRGRHHLMQMDDFLKRWGFELELPAGRRALKTIWAEFWQRIYNWALIWTFNPLSLDGRKLREFRNGRFWISRGFLTEKYGKPPDNEKQAFPKDDVGAWGGV
jgi:ceramide glucosyltransferase